MAEDIEVGVLGLLALAGEVDEFLIAFPLVDFGITQFLTTGGSGPMIAEPVAEARRQKTVEELRNGIVEVGTEETEFPVGRAESVAMGKIACLAIEHHFFGLVVNNDTRFASEPSVGPDIVIAYEEMDRAMSGSFLERRDNRLELSEMTLVRPIVFHPEIKDITEEVDGISVLLHLLQERDEALLMLPGISNHERTEMNIADKINQKGTY